MSENWKPVVGYEGRYEVSDHGRVWSHVTKRLMRGSTGRGARSGYKRVGLPRDGGDWNVEIHRLVLEAFDRPCQGDEVCRHLNGDPADNRLENLRWGSRRENNEDTIRHGRQNQVKKTHCPAGHAYAEHGSTYHYRNEHGPTVHRVCRPCRKARQDRRRQPVTPTAEPTATVDVTAEVTP